jgi:hypothetical protein
MADVILIHKEVMEIKEVLAILADRKGISVETALNHLAPEGEVVTWVVGAPQGGSNVYSYRFVRVSSKMM